MRLGVLSDVHGNCTAAAAVIADGRACGVDRWWVLGDLVAIGPDPVATLELLANVPNLVATRGNTERYVLTRDRPSPSADDVIGDPRLLELFAAVEGSFAWTRGALSTGAWLDWLDALPLEVRVELDDGTRLLGVHATPGRDDGEGITPNRPDDELLAALDGAAADIVCAGHTHQPTDRRVGVVRAVNGGSVSNPITDDLRPSYAIVHADRHGHRLEHRRVAYDREAFLRRVERSGHGRGIHQLVPAGRAGKICGPSRRRAVVTPRSRGSAVVRGTKAREVTREFRRYVVDTPLLVPDCGRSHPVWP